MTRDEILNMPAGNEMDALVAEKVMGQTDFEHPGFYWQEKNYAESDGWEGFYCPVCDASEGSKDKCCIHYSTDIAAAWKVVEIMLDLLSTPGQYGGERTGRCALYLNRTRSLDFNTAWYQVYFARQGGKDKVVAESSMGESAPLAICRAALLAIMSEDFDAIPGIPNTHRCRCQLVKADA